MKKQILFADDDPSIRGMMKTLVRCLGSPCEFIVAEDGEEAYALFQEYYPKGNLAAVITDLRMPVLDGASLARRIRETYPHNNVPILAMTGYEITDSKTESLFERVIHKPVDLSILEATINKYSIAS